MGILLTIYDWFSNLTQFHIFHQDKQILLMRSLITIMKTSNENTDSHYRATPGQVFKKQSANYDSHSQVVECTIMESTSSKITAAVSERNTPSCCCSESLPLHQNG